jgi:hypothetical protein
VRQCDSAYVSGSSAAVYRNVAVGGSALCAVVRGAFFKKLLLVIIMMNNLADNLLIILGDFTGFYEGDFAQDFDEGRPRVGQTGLFS